MIYLSYKATRGIGIVQSILKRVYSSKKISLALKIISHLSVAVGTLVFFGILIHSYFNEPLLYSVKLLLCAAIPFFLVTAARKIINAPRPYELYGFYEMRPKDKEGQSLPSRHVFSAFVIATLSYLVSTPLAIALAALGVCLAVCRVLLGLHFIRDVVCGALIGILSGIIGILIII